jgi:hypothetical protein
MASCICDLLKKNVEKIPIFFKIGGALDLRAFLRAIEI